MYRTNCAKIFSVPDWSDTSTKTYDLSTVAGREQVPINIDEVKGVCFIYVRENNEYYRLISDTTSGTTRTLVFSGSKIITITVNGTVMTVEFTTNSGSESITDITENEFSDELKLKTIKDYVTPQMYGAKADGSTNDSVAIQSAIDSGKPVVFPKGTYVLSNTINIVNKSHFYMDARYAAFDYRGTEFAFKLTKVRYSTFYFDEIHSNRGGCIYFESVDSNTWSQYINIYFNWLYASTSADCVRAKQEGSNWINEVRWFNGRVYRGLNGFHFIRNTPNNHMTHWNFYNVGIEGEQANNAETLNTGFLFEGETTSTKGIGNFLFAGCRFEEHFVKLVSVNGVAVRGMHFVECSAFPYDKCDVNELCNNWVIDGVVDAYSKLKFGVWVTEQDHFSLQGGKVLAQNTNLNDVVDFGNYYANTNAILNTLTNCPTTDVFVLKVINTGGVLDTANYKYKLQVLIDRRGNIYTRVLTVINGGNWNVGDWTNIVTGNNKINIPVLPTSDGDYVLKCSVASGTPTFTWSTE